MSMFGPVGPTLNISGGILSINDQATMSSSSVNIVTSIDVSSAVASWAAYPASQAVNCNGKAISSASSVTTSGSVIADGNVVCATVNAGNVNATGVVAAGNLQLQYSTIAGGAISVPALKNINIGPGSTNAIQISGSGNVGIGKAPGVALDVNGTINGSADINAAAGISAYGTVSLRPTGGAVGQGTMLKFGADYPGDAYQIELNKATTTSPNQLDIRIVGADDGANNRSFDIGNYTGNDRTQTWNSKFKVNSHTGNITATGDVTTTGSAVVGSSIKMTNHGTYIVWNYGATNGSTGLGAPTMNELALYTASAERMRITSAGNVGIGTTPSGGYKLEVLGGVYASGTAYINGNVTSGGSVTGRSFYTYSALTGTVSQNGYGALFMPPETGAYLFSAYLTSAPGTAYIMGMVFSVSGTIVRVSTQATTLMVATGDTSLLIQNLSATSSTMRITVQRFGL